MKVAYYTLGCKVNQYETEKIRAEFEKLGYETVPFSEGGDIFVINTCTVTSVADGKSRAVIRKAKKINPLAKVVVTGCYSQTHREEAESIEEADIIVDIKDKIKIPYMFGSGEKSEKQGTVTDLRVRTRAVLKVQDGCSQFCSYCLIPFARSHKSATPIEEAVEETVRLCQAGYKEIVLTGIRLGSYRDGEKGLGELIESLLAKTDIERIRLSSIEMWEIDERLIDLMKEGRMCNHLHIPLQNGSDRILKLMNRPYSRDEYYGLVSDLREKIPDLGLTTDIIAGFPGESEEDFEESCAFAEKIGFSRIHVFRYSRRPGTKADLMTGHIDPETKKKRVAYLTELGGRLAQNFAEKHIGKECSILFEVRKKDGFTYGYTRNYIEAKTDRPVKRNETLTLTPINAENGTLTV